MTLETCLNRLSTETLQKIYESREIGLDTNEKMPTQRVALLAKVMRDLRNGYSHSAAIRDLDARELRLLQIAAICEQGEHLLWSQAIEEAGGKPTEPVLRATFVRLEALGLLFEEENGSLFLQNEVKRQVPVLLSERYGLEACLLNENAQNLRRIASRVGVNPNGAKSEIASRIFEAMIYSEPGKRPYDRLKDDEKVTFDALLEYGGVAPIHEFARRHVPGHRNNSYYPQTRNSAIAHVVGQGSDVLDRLLETGMVYLASYTYSYSQQLVIPRDIVRALKGDDRVSFWLGDAPALSLLAEMAIVTRRNDGILSDAVMFLAALLRVEAIQTQSGLINKVVLKSIAKLYFREDELYTGFIYAILRSAGLIMAYSDRRRYVVTQQGMAWLELPPPVQWLMLVGAWVECPHWLETQSDPLSSDTPYHSGSVALAIRGLLMDALPPEVTEHFYSVRSLTEAMLFRAPLLLSPTGDNEELSTPVHYFGRLVGQSLLWLGCLEGAFERPTTLSQEPEPVKRGQKPAPTPPPTAVGFRFTAAGAAIFKHDLKALEAEMPEEAGFYLQPNGDIIAPPYLKASLRYRLLSLTDPAPKQSGTLQVTRDSVRRALDEGETGKTMLDFLKEHSRSGVPQPIEYLINEVAGKHGHIRVGAAKFYLQVDDPLLIKELQARKEFARVLKNKIGETAITLEIDDLDKFMRDLRKAGYSPIRDEAAARKRIPPKAPLRDTNDHFAEALMGISLDDDEADEDADEDDLFDGFKR